MKILGEDITINEGVTLATFIGAGISLMYYGLKRIFTFILLIDKFEKLEQKLDEKLEENHKNVETRLTSQDNKLDNIINIIDRRKEFRSNSNDPNRT